MQTYAFSIKKNCNKVTTFKIGNIDKEFNLPKEEMIKYAKSAARLWNDGLGVKVLEYNDDASNSKKVIINFVYDERQKNTIKKNILSEKKKEKSIILENKLKDLNIEKEKYQSLQNNSEKDWNNFRSKLDIYNLSVTKANQIGGAETYEYNRLNEDKNKLESEKSDLDNKDKKIKNFFETLNINIKNYNQLVSEANILVKEINKDAGKKFEQGTYSNKKINIYEYENENTLKILLAHELAHSFGMDHVKSTSSIMYYINSGGKFALTKDDITEYYRICSAK